MAEKNNNTATMDESTPAAAAAKPSLKDSMQQSIRTIGQSSKQMMDNTMQTVSTKTSSTRESLSTKATEFKHKANDLATDLKTKAVGEPKIEHYAKSEEEGLTMLKALIETAKEKQAARVESNVSKWDLETSPISTLGGKTLDDVFMAFVKWSKMEVAGDAAAVAVADAATTNTYNITKAFGRLESFVNWMHKTGRDLIDPHITIDGLKEAQKAWNPKISYDKEGHVVWWIDNDAMDVEKLKQGGIPTVDSLRLFVWLSHYIMLDPQAQAKGMIVVHNMANMSLWESVKLMPPPLTLKLDRLTIGTLPVKLKHVYLVQSPKWSTVLMKMLKPFLSAKMKERVVQIEYPTYLEEVLGADAIPQGFFGTQGLMQGDLLGTQYFMD